MSDAEQHDVSAKAETFKVVNPKKDYNLPSTKKALHFLPVALA